MRHTMRPAANPQSRSPHSKAATWHAIARASTARDADSPILPCKEDTSESARPASYGTALSRKRFSKKRGGGLTSLAGLLLIPPEATAVSRAAVIRECSLRTVLGDTPFRKRIYS